MIGFVPSLIKRVVRTATKSTKVIVTAATFAFVLRKTPIDIKQNIGQSFANGEIHRRFQQVYQQKPVRKETHVKMDIPDYLPFDIRIPKKKKVEIVVPEWAGIIGTGSQWTKHIIGHIQRGDQGDPGDHESLKNDIIKKSRLKSEEETVDLASVLKEYRE